MSIVIPAEAESMYIVIPAKAGIHAVNLRIASSRRKPGFSVIDVSKSLGPGFRRGDSS